MPSVQKKRSARVAPQFACLGDQGVLVYLPDEEQSIRFAAAVRDAGFSWLVDLVPAYVSVGVYFDPRQIRLAEVREALLSLDFEGAGKASKSARQHVIPCCYELNLDLARVAEHTKLTADEVIALHTSTSYTIYAIGFCPGFPYLGYLPQKLTGVPRLAVPRMSLEAGSVGLTARQTGLYPLARPGGWNIIGLTPLELVNVEDDYFPLQVGDQVRFQRIDETEFVRQKGNRLI
jgi:inhibitor of KinA